MNYNCERCGDRLGWREHVGPTLCELCRLRAEVERLNTRLVSAETYRDAARDEAERLRAALTYIYEYENVGLSFEKWVGHLVARKDEI